MLNQLTILKVSSMLLSFTYAKSVNILKVSFTLLSLLNQLTILKVSSMLLSFTHANSVNYT